MSTFPKLMWVLPLVSAILCSVGFYKFVYFLSIGYGFAVAGEGIAMLLMFKGESGIAVAIQCILFVIYGIRLGGFLVIRELKSVSYRNTLAAVTKEEKPMPVFVKATIWICVSLLYVCQVAPVYYRQANGMSQDTLSWIGVVIMVIAIIIESAADKQKSAAKAKNPARFCDIGLYKIVRCPNYFGELLFWTGVFVSGVNILDTPGQWIISLIGYIAIIYIMFNGAKRLELRQNGSYGKDPEYQSYVKSTPIILPLVPIYSLKDSKIIK